MIAAHLAAELDCVLVCGPGYHAPQAVDEDTPLPVAPEPAKPTHILSRRQRPASYQVAERHLAAIVGVLAASLWPLTNREIAAKYAGIGLVQIGNAVLMLEDSKRILRVGRVEHVNGRPVLWVAA